MKFSRIWAMSNKWTFTIKPIKELLEKYVGDGTDWIDPFAGQHSPAEITNDINPDRPTKYHLVHIPTGTYKNKEMYLFRFIMKKAWKY